MRCIIAGTCCLIALLAWAAPPRAVADEHDKPAAGAKHKDDDKHGPPKYLGHVHDENGKEVEREYDLSKRQDRQDLIHDIEHGHVGELKKKEPLDLFGIKRWHLGIWSIVIFVTLFLVLKKFAWGPMLSGLKKREDTIRGALEQAEKTRRETMELQSRLDAKMHDAGGEIARMMDDARRDAAALKDQMVAEGRAEIQKEKDRAKREIESDRDQALVEIKQHSVGLAALMSAKAVRRSLTDDDHRRFLDESLAELRQSGGRFGQA